MSNTFYLQEHELLRTKIEKRVETMERIQVLVGGANATLFAWTFTAKLDLAPALAAASLSLFLTGFGYWRNRTLVAHVAQVCEYLKSIEAYLTDSRGPIGWERFYDPNQSGTTSWRTIYWVAMFGASIAGILVIYLIKSHPPGDALSISIIGR